ncbi:MAG: hypothetical protein K1X82_10945 [Bacteroidia bacterium]|nr:hypothetical protein [Bacteroidia bacterium]
METFSRGTKVTHPQYGEGTIVSVDEFTYQINFQTRGKVEVSKKFTGLKAEKEMPELDESIEWSALEIALINVLNKYSDLSPTIPLGDKWIGGKLIFEPGTPGLKGKEIPIETFFHKVVMVRDRLRVLEQNINSNDKLSPEEKVNLQQYITKCYGSLTTFNELFRRAEDKFVGDKKSGE